MAQPLQPSPKRIVHDYLSTNAAVTALTTALSPNKVTDGLCVRYWLIPGGAIVLRRYVIRSRFQIDCFGPAGSGGDATDLLARTVWAELGADEFLGTQPSGGAVVAVDVGVPADLPDDANPGQSRPRQMFDLLLTTHH